MKDVVYTPESSDSHCEIIEDNDSIKLKQSVTYETRELAAVCPFSGLPDQAILKVTYIPNRYVLELKSFKYYLISFRNVGIYQEHLTQRIYKDLKNVLEPEFLEITTIYNTRGGIDSISKISSSEQ
ncbi:preQ(1) synthase [bacterium]|nr:preQ(1) synthase [bacterium]